MDKANKTTFFRTTRLLKLVVFIPISLIIALTKEGWREKCLGLIIKAILKGEKYTYHISIGEYNLGISV